MANRMDSVKTTINVDDETLREFKKMVTSKYGSARRLSAAVEEAMRTYNSTEILSAYAVKEGIAPASYPSSREVKERRPHVKASAGKTLREMRDAREVSLSRHE